MDSWFYHNKPGRPGKGQPGVSHQEGLSQALLVFSKKLPYSFPGRFKRYSPSRQVFFQPYLVPVILSSSRSTQRRGICASTST